MPVHKHHSAISWGTSGVGMFLWLLNKSLLGACTAGSHFRIPNMQVAGEGTTKAQAACRAQAGELCLENQAQESSPYSYLPVLWSGLCSGHLLGESCLLSLVVTCRVEKVNIASPFRKLDWWGFFFCLPFFPPASFMKYLPVCSKLWRKGGWSIEGVRRKWRIFFSLEKEWVSVELL